MRGAQLTGSGHRRGGSNRTDFPVLPCARVRRERDIRLYRPGRVYEAERVAPAEAVARHRELGDVERVTEVVDCCTCQWIATRVESR